MVDEHRVAAMLAADPDGPEWADLAADATPDDIRALKCVLWGFYTARAGGFSRGAERNRRAVALFIEGGS
jgi:hypothetical protein